ncbi:helix-turn-helix transcriptional regulator [Saccharolobus shibatae]|uniref:helix-turn-helix transcriptional regulator n=1 Tax=Saccharolobus shibatae TaxID=2286 RepID=UPI001C48F4B9|nr:MarR family winged helix-turn-helix transcriptional regulator [Saccharolobus shibatae]
MYEIVKKMLNEHEKAMLKLVYSKNGLTTKEILDLFGSHSLGYKALKGLEEKGLIEKVKGRRRSQNIFLTDYGKMIYQLLYTNENKQYGDQSFRKEQLTKPKITWISVDNEGYVSGDDFFKCYEWCEGQGKHNDEFDRCVKECLGIKID